MREKIKHKTIEEIPLIEVQPDEIGELTSHRIYEKGKEDAISYPNTIKNLVKKIKPTPKLLSQNGCSNHQLMSLNYQ